MKEIPEYEQSIIHMLAHAFSEENLTAWVVRDVKKKEDRVLIGMIYVDEEGNEDSIPLAILDNEKGDFFDQYSFDYYDKPISYQEKKPWWHFWR